jgi:uncharacterized protein
MPTIEQAREWYSETDGVHGFAHVLRVVRLAERLAQAQGGDMEIVRAAALLHDVNGAQAGEAERLGHHQAAAEWAGALLREEGWTEERVRRVQHCIRAHRFRDRSEPPQTLEAQILFDADKLDAIGATGAARAIGYALQAGQPVYAQPSQKFVESGELEAGEAHSAYHEYLFKLRRIRERLYTPLAQQIAAGRQAVMEDFFTALRAEMEGKG